MENGSPAEAVFAMMGDPRDDAMEATSFQEYSSLKKVLRWEYNRGHPRRAYRKGDFKSRGVAVRT